MARTRKTEAPAKGVSLKKAVVAHLLATRNKAQNLSDLYNGALAQGHVPGAGLTPLATLSASLGGDERFERTAPSTFRLRPEAAKEARKAVTA